MRACFLGQNICNLGYGVATLQAPRLVMDEPVRMRPDAEKSVSSDQNLGTPEAPIEPRPVANSQRLNV
jgi:hypothetical protein